MEFVRCALGNDDHGTLRLLGGVLFGIGELVSRAAVRDVSRTL
jgi:hypothetical protein